MENLDLTVLRALRDWRRAGHHALMATVVRTWGSSPRPVGSIMALCDSGAVVGSVSGGCIEDDLIARYTQADAADTLRPTAAGAPPRFVKYGVTAEISVVSSGAESNELLASGRMDGGTLGLGTAVIAGMKYGIEHGYRYVLNMDADFSHHPRYLPEMIAAMETIGREVLGFTVGDDHFDAC